MLALSRGRRGLAAAASALALAALASGCSTSDASSTGSKGYVTGSGLVQLVAQDDRENPIELSGTSLLGDHIDLADYRGQPVVINVWGSWCTECRIETDDLVKAYGELPDVAFIGVNTRESNPSAGQAYVRSEEIPYDSLYDEDNTMLLAFNGAIGPNSIPSTVVLDADGRIAGVVQGVLTASTLVGMVEDVENDS